MPRFRLIDDDDDASLNSSEEKEKDLPLHNDKDGETENEPPHPIGFDALPKQRPGQSRYNLDFDDDDEDWLEQKVCHPPRPSQQLPMSAYLQTNQNTTLMRVLIKDAYLDAARNHEQEEDDGEDDDDDDGLDGLLDTMQAIALSTPSTNVTALVPRLPPPQDPTYYNLGNKERQIHELVAQKGQKLQQENKVLSQRLKLYIDKQRQEAERLLAERKQFEREEQEKAEEAARKEEAERQRQEEADAEKKRQDEIDAKARAEQEAKQKAQDEKVAQKKAEEERKRKEELNYVEKAQKLVGQLEAVRQSVEPFDKSKPMAKRRLAMKKVVNGRVNTLSEDVGKILAVATDVNQAIATARQDDAAIKSQIEGGNTQYSAEMALGKRYFLDLLSAKVIVRVQAEGFNGQRGDGFPLAHCLAHVAKENTDFVPILQAHVFKVCPTAIPNLPMPAENASEDELMESLGMIKDKDGNYETFERFLNRTEGIISIVADIMASQPEHQLFQGSAGAVKWLKRFLQQLPAPPQSPLPLLTAPVLDAFLTGAGHMLANCFGDEFRKLLGSIEKNVMTRLDEGTIGAPSSIRLKKTMKDGFDGFLNKLPPKALKDLYRVGAGQPAVQGTVQPAAAQSTAPNPFGATSSAVASAPNPFGGTMATGASASAVTSTPNPFGGASSAAAPSPFTSATSTAAPSPFGSNSGMATSSGMMSEPNAQSAFNAAPNASTSASPFGNTGPLTSPFGATAAPAPTQFGSAGPAPSPFSSGPGPFGASSAPAPSFGTTAVPAMTSPFGSTAAPSPSPFSGGGGGFGASGVAAPSNPFGGNAAPAPTPFGSAQAPAPSPFSGAGGFGTPAPAPSNPFGAPAPAPMPFGSAQAPAPSPFSGGTGGFGAPAPAPSNPFGAPSPAPTPFGVAGPAPTPFSGGAGGFGASAPAPSNPFGATAPPPTPFGVATPAPTPFGSPNNQQGGFGGAGNKQPCRFFAKGTCKYGANCKFSHNIQPATTSFSSPFGGPPRR